MEEKSFVTRQIQCRRYGGQERLSTPFWFIKIVFLEHHATGKLPTIMQKGIITFNLTYLAKVTYISSIFQFLNNESLVVQVSNTRSKPEASVFQTMV